MNSLINFLQSFNLNKKPLRFYLLILLVNLFPTSLLIGQSATWTGTGNGTDWDDPNNWNFASNGSLTNVNTRYNIPQSTAGPTTASGTSLIMKSLHVKNGASATVPNGFSIEINSKNQYVVPIHNNGTFVIAAGGSVTAHNSKDSEGLWHNTNAVGTYVHGSLTIYDIGDPYLEDDLIYLEAGILEISGTVHLSQLD